MEENRQDPAPERKPGWIRRAMIFLGILVFFSAMYFLGEYVYRLGQNTAAGFSGLDTTPTVEIKTSTPGPPTATSAPAPTSTTYFPPTATPTKIPWTSCPGIVIRVTDTAEGDILHVLRCADGSEYDIGPLTKGVYAVSPDDTYLVYCSLNGVLYAARIGSPTLTVIRKVNRDFFTFGRDMDPIFELTFNSENPKMLEIYERRYQQNLPVNIPGWLSQ